MVSISCVLPTARSDFSLLGQPKTHIFLPTFRSLSAQTFRDFEVIVVDALFNQRAEWLHTYVGDEYPLKYVPVHPNHRYWLDRKRWNVAGQLNTALLYCEGELVVRLDDCCELDAGYLQKFWDEYQKGYWPMAMHIRYLGDKPARFDAEYVKNGYEAKYAQGRETDRIETLRKLYGDEGIIRDTRYQIVKDHGGRMVAPPDWFYGYASAPLEALLKVNGYDERFDGDKSLEDADCGSRLSLAGFGGLPVLDVAMQVIEHEHGPIQEDVIARGQKTMKCVPPSTMVIRGGAPVKIGEINEGDCLLSMDGRHKTVNKILKRDFNGSLVKITPCYTNIPLLISDKHPILRKMGPDLQWANARDITADDYLVYPRMKGNLGDSFLISSYVEKGSLRGHCKLRDNGWQLNQFNQQPLDDRVKITPAFMQLVGYYLGEGCVSGSAALVFSFNDREKPLIDDVVHSMEEIFGVKPWRVRREKTAWVIRYTSTLLVRLFKALFGDKGNEKHLPTLLLLQPDALIRELLKTFYLSEGLTKFPSYRFRGAYYQMNTCSESLAHQLRLLFHKLGIAVMLWRRDPNPANTSVMADGRIIVPRSPMFYLQIPSSFDDCMEQMTGVKHPERRPMKFAKPYFMIDENFVYIRVREVSAEKYDGELINLEMDGETYTATGLVVHNCNYALYLLNRARKNWRANTSELTWGECEQIRSHVCPACNNYVRCRTEELSGKFWTDDTLLADFVLGQRVFDLREERMTI